jgi:hypothetical protein
MTRDTGLGEPDSLIGRPGPRDRHNARSRPPRSACFALRGGARRPPACLTSATEQAALDLAQLLVERDRATGCRDGVLFRFARQACGRSSPDSALAIADLHGQTRDPACRLARPGFGEFRGPGSVVVGPVAGVRALTGRLFFRDRPRGGGHRVRSLAEDRARRRPAGSDARFRPIASVRSAILG